MRILAAFVLFAAVSAQHGDYGGGGGGGGGGGHHHLEEYKDYQSHPHYNFHYGVHDTHTHDLKDQWEAREGHNTKGSYSFLQPDGRKRIVEYHADKHGIHYNVKFEGHAVHEEGKRGYDVHGKSSSQQYAHAVTNYHGPTHHGGGGGGGGGEGHGHGGGGGGGGGEGHGHGGGGGGGGEGHGHGGGGGGGGGGGYGHGGGGLGHGGSGGGGGGGHHGESVSQQYHLATTNYHGPIHGGGGGGGGHGHEGGGGGGGGGGGHGHEGGGGGGGGGHGAISYASYITHGHEIGSHHH